MAKLVPEGHGKSRYSDRLHNFSVTISRYYKDVCVNNFSPPKATHSGILCF